MSSQWEAAVSIEKLTERHLIWIALAYTGGRGDMDKLVDASMALQEAKARRIRLEGK